jgi:hypothetical protein
MRIQIFSCLLWRKNETGNISPEENGEDYPENSD